MYLSKFAVKISMGKLAAGMLAFSALTAYSVYAADTDPDADYDRLDGSGASGEKVQVIEWEGNLEVHVYPVGSLRGLGLKLDNKNKDKPVMVLAYRFGGKPQIRRAILGIDLHDNFKVYKDPTENEFDKIIITGNSLGAPIVAYKTDPAPTQLYPDGYAKALAQAGGNIGNARRPAAQSLAQSDDGEDEDAPVAPAGGDDNGRISPFFMRSSGASGGGGGNRR